MIKHWFVTTWLQNKFLSKNMFPLRSCYNKYNVSPEKTSNTNGNGITFCCKIIWTCLLLTKDYII